jgi:hypothetical protein
MSKHWKPEDDVVRVEARVTRKSWPEGATAGLILVAAACLGAAVILYQVAGPRQVFEKDSSLD